MHMQQMFEYAYQTYAGKSRVDSPNEDSVAVYVKGESTQPGNGVAAVFCVADGMGGGHDGEVASQRVLAGLLSFFAEDRLPSFAATRGIPPDLTAHLLKDAVVHLNDDLVQFAASQGKNMGTTLDALVVRDDRYYLAHVGDSRVYLIREARIEQLTEDHSAVEELVRMNVPRAQAVQMFGSNVVTNIMGTSAMVKVDMREGDVQPGDVFVLCTDGLTETVGSPDIMASIGQHDSWQGVCDELVRMANERDGSDNITVLLAEARSLS